VTLQKIQAGDVRILKKKAMSWALSEWGVWGGATKLGGGKGVCVGEKKLEIGSFQGRGRSKKKSHLTTSRRKNKKKELGWWRKRQGNAGEEVYKIKKQRKTGGQSA